MSTEYLATIDALVERSARALFDAHGLSLGRLHPSIDEALADHDVACSIGFSSPQIHGALLMTTRKSVVARAWPPELRHRTPTEREVCDLAGELLNQLLGRVKNGLSPFGLALDQGTPTIVVGVVVRRAPASTAVARRYVFDLAGASLAIHLDAVVVEGFALSEVDDEGPRGALEGDLRLF
jgi:hypothetical protein